MVRQFIYGPFQSRRLGLSLGVNILENKKICTYNCVYCEIGHTEKENIVPPTYKIVKSPKGQFSKELNLMLKFTPNLDSITFGYNGETTLNSEIDSFLRIARKVRDKRKWESKKPKLTLFTNSSTIHLKEIRKKIVDFDLILAKLDAGNQKDFSRTNRPHLEVPSIEVIIDSLTEIRKEKSDKTELALQTLLYNSYDKSEGNNSNQRNIKSLVKAIRKIKPNIVQIYSIARIPAEPFVYSIDDEKKDIAEKLRKIINDDSIKIDIF